MAIRRSRHDQLENDLNRGALWAVTYGDLMSYLMIFFLIMFSFSVSKSARRAGEQRKYQESLVSIQKVFGGRGSSPDYARAVQKEREESMVSQLREALDKSNLSQYAKLESWDKKVRLVLAEGVMFDSGKTELKPDARKILASIAREMKALDNPIVIEGHTDNVPVRGGRYKTNWELSMTRAYMVLKFLEDNGVASGRLAGIGYGEHRPLADNSTPEGRAKNRRIEIDLIRND